MSIINILDLTFSYDSSFDPIFKDVSFQIDTDWKLGFTGRNGRGKTTFLNLLMGRYPYQGKITSSVTFDYFPYAIWDNNQDTLSLMNQIITDSELWKLQRELSLLEVSEEVLNRPFCTLSKGEQTKILLAALFLKESNFLLIDEPTNHLDMNARKRVSSYLDSKKGYILVSHDRTFLDRCVDHILSINKTDIEVQRGNFSSWYHNKQLQDQYEISGNEKLQKDIKRLKLAAERTAMWADRVEGTKIGFDPVKREKNISNRAYIGEKARKMMKRSKSISSRQEAAIQEKALL